MSTKTVDKSNALAEKINVMLERYDEQHKSNILGKTALISAMTGPLVENVVIGIPMSKIVNPGSQVDLLNVAEVLKQISRITDMMEREGYRSTGMEMGGTKNVPWPNVGINFVRVLDAKLTART